MSSTYLRCSHCRGFYERDLPACRYCTKDVPLKDAAGHAKIFPDRNTCRAIQTAEFEQLPKKAHDDPFQPDPEVLDKLCSCLHCGPDAGTFEAVEMRWMVNENMWACPCTTCGGRGFGIDIHLNDPLWQCAECSHWYAPANGIRYASNAKCPKCGSTMANGWFDDEPLTPEEEAELEKEWKEFDAKHGKSDAAPAALDEDDEADNEESDDILGFEADAEAWKAAADTPREQEKMPDDIDFPRNPPDPPDPSEEGPLSDKDIPW